MRAKKLTRVFLLICMVVVLLPVRSFAAEEAELIYELPSMEMSTEVASYSVRNTFTGPTLSEGKHEKWIDRIANLPDYAADFYEWLVENGTVNGALADVKKGELVEGNYVYTVGSMSGSFEVTFKSNASSTEINEGIQNAASEVFSKNNKEAFSYILATYNAFSRDCPETFWLSGEGRVSAKFLYGYSNIGNTYKISYSQPIYFILQTPEYDVREKDYCNLADLISANNIRDKKVNEIIDECVGSNRYETLKNFNEWLTTHNCYNNSSNLNTIDRDCRNGINTLIGSAKADGPVCEGYAKALKMLCDKTGIPCVLVDGVAGSGSRKEAHMWNYVQMEDSNWYAVDVTWNDPVVYGITSVESGYEREDYLLVGGNTNIGGVTFNEDHILHNTVSNGGLAFTNGPVLSEEAYEPAEEPDDEPLLNGVIKGEGDKYYCYKEGVVDTTQNGLVYCEEIENYIYVEEGVQDISKYDLVDYQGGKFFVVNGVMANSISGLQLIGNNFYFLAYGQLQNQYTGLTLYDNEWFYIEEGVLAIGFNGVKDYDGSKFLIAAGRIVNDYVGLFNDAATGNWYYMVYGQVQTQYTGLVQYDGSWFYVEGGIYDTTFNGTIEYDGAQFKVINGMVIF